MFFPAFPVHRVGQPMTRSRVLGEVAEWPKAHAWKACVAQVTEGSNPSLSANNRVGVGVGGSALRSGSRVKWVRPGMEQP